MRKKVAVLLLTYDGVTSWYCGLGSITQYFIHSMPEAVRILKKEGREVSFFIGLPFTTKGCLGYRKDLLPKTKKIIRKLGGDIIYFSDNSDGISQYGSLENWQSASNGAASVVINIVEKFDQVIVYSFDTPYCAVGRNVSKQLSH